MHFHLLRLCYQHLRPLGASASEASLLSVNARGESIFIYVELLIYLANGFAFVNSNSSSGSSSNKVGKMGLAAEEQRRQLAFQFGPRSPIV